MKIKNKNHKKNSEKLIFLLKILMIYNRGSQLFYVVAPFKNTEKSVFAYFFNFLKRWKNIILDKY